MVSFQDVPVVADGLAEERVHEEAGDACEDHVRRSNVQSDAESSEARRDQPPVESDDGRLGHVQAHIEEKAGGIDGLVHTWSVKASTKRSRSAVRTFRYSTESVMPSSVRG